MRSIYCILFTLFSSSIFAQGTQLLRQPTISDDAIVFVYANDLWRTSINGGDAIRMTTNEGYESRPHFSVDGRWVAFSAQYGGNTDVYIMPSAGGEPQRLTWHPGGDFVQGWTPEGKVLFRSGRDAYPTVTNRIYEVAISGGLPTPINAPRAAYGEISADGKYAAYTPITGWDPEWRNYRGGQAMPIWIQDLKTNDLITTPQIDGERHLDPVWHEGKVYYLSERDYASNIWSFDLATKQERQITTHKKFDVKSLDASTNHIVYEQGGYLHVMNMGTGQTNQIAVNVQGDMNFARPRWENVSGRQLSNANISPNGKRVLFEHRGEIFSIPKEHGSWRNLTNTSGVADRYPIWSPKGDQIAYFSDKGGEYQLVLADQMGAVQKSIPIPNKKFYFVPDWSSDGQYLSFSDTDYNLWVVNITTGVTTQYATDRYAHPNRTMNPQWSPDSKWIAYEKQLDSHFKAVFGYNVITKHTIQMTDGMADATSPVWDVDGKYLYVLGSTNYGLASGWLDMSSYDPTTTRSLYAIVLDADGKAPNLPQSDEEESAKKDDAKKDEEKKNEENSDKNGKDDKNDILVTVSEQGIYDRLVALKLDDGNYLGLESGPKGTVFIGEGGDDPGLKLHKYDVQKQKAEVFAEGVGNITTSADRKHILYSKSGSWTLSETKGAKGGKEALKTNVRILVDPQAEYHQIFKEGWRYMRDFLYVDNVHGAPWDKVYEWYAPWIDHVRHRTDLNYVVDIMSGEVAIGHSYVSGGDMPDLNNVPVGLLGVDLKETNGMYQISKIYRGERWNPNIEAPLGLPGIGIKEGDYIHAINGHELKASNNPYELLAQTAGREIYIKVGASASGSATKEILVKPVRSERGLRTIDWVESNRRKVDELSNGELAYVYIPNTSGPGFNSFNRYYFAQQDKKGVILDERNNGGGSAADYMIDVMARQHFGYFNSKAGDKRPWTTPIAGIWGPKVMLINERAGSGGDLLPYMFRAAELGPLVGTKTWGGLVGTWDTPRFIDGGRMVAPRGGFYDVDGKWAVEGEGIAPDIEVIQDPKLTAQGRDPQLERGVEEAMKLLKTQRFEIKPEPAPPVRWKRPAGWEKSNN